GVAQDVVVGHLLHNETGNREAAFGLDHPTVVLVRDGAAGVENRLEQVFTAGLGADGAEVGADLAADSLDGVAAHALRVVLLRGQHQLATAVGIATAGEQGRDAG